MMMMEMQVRCHRHMQKRFKIEINEQNTHTFGYSEKKQYTAMLTERAEHQNEKERTVVYVAAGVRQSEAKRVWISGTP